MWTLKELGDVNMDTSARTLKGCERGHLHEEVM